MEQPFKWSRNKSDSPIKDKDLCVTCGKEAITDGVECQWCMKWEYKVCSKITDDEYTMLDGMSQNIMFFCSSCSHKVPMALSHYELCSQMDTKLEVVQSQIVKSIEDTNLKQSKQVDSKFEDTELKISKIFLRY